MPAGESGERSARSGTEAQRPLEGLVYGLCYPLLAGLARLPLPLLYRLGDVACFLAYRVLRVRRRIARANLRRVFPDAPREELARIEAASYRNLFEVAVEGLKLMTAGPDEIRGLMELDMELVRQEMNAGRSMIFALGHCGNWEWANPSACLDLPGLRIHIVYHPLRHPGFDRLFGRVRARYGSVLTPMPDAFRTMVRMRREAVPTATILVADQRPRRRGAVSVPFFGSEAPFFSGPERIARRLGLPIFYIDIERVARGRYKLVAEWLCEDPAATEEGEITAAFARRLEQQIRKAPEGWLWAHRRWRDRAAERS